MTIDKVKEYYESEYLDVKRVIENKYPWAEPRQIVLDSIQKMLGVGMFAQNFDDVTYEAIYKLYNFYKEKLESLLTTD